jgi:Holliday junction DNA helicase RuvA
LAQGAPWGYCHWLAPNDLLTYISRGDANYLTKVSGIGKKTAEKIILELRDKIKNMVNDDEGIGSVTNDALDALTALGYSAQDIRNALAQLPPDIDTNDTQIVIRAVLKIVRKM